ncbi:septum formation initiator family protein [Microbacterium sp. G2-8]|uniref:FtsB family cell division protein n=1 Tax=Microbacterium sp. G2-8 TaxID=2842454 RepID=UPI001C89B3E8|nr:septum formation initiator family protein [Microbacterium sp. G2-8]
MARSAAPSPRSRRPPGEADPGSGVDVRDWLGGIRLSGFAVIMLGLVVLAAFVLVPSASSYIDMRQQIAQAESGVQMTEAEITELERERDRWQDPAFIMSQARERLYYVKPGEVVFLIDDDVARDEVETEPAPVEAEVSERDHDWMGVMLRSVVSAGLAEQATSGAGGDVFQPTPTPADGDAE